MKWLPPTLKSLGISFRKIGEAEKLRNSHKWILIQISWLELFKKGKMLAFSTHKLNAGILQQIQTSYRQVSKSCKQTPFYL
jgi:hypothetical protein